MISSIDRRDLGAPPPGAPPPEALCSATFLRILAHVSGSVGIGGMPAGGAGPDPLALNWNIKEADSK